MKNTQEVEEMLEDIEFQRFCRAEERRRSHNMVPFSSDNLTKASFILLKPPEESALQSVLDRLGSALAPPSSDRRLVLLR